MDGDFYIKTYAVSLMRDGETAVKALARAREAWAHRQECERIIDKLMEEESNA